MLGFKSLTHVRHIVCKKEEGGEPLILQAYMNGWRNDWRGHYKGRKTAKSRTTYTVVEGHDCMCSEVKRHIEQDTVNMIAMKVCDVISSISSYFNAPISHMSNKCLYYMQNIKKVNKKVIYFIIIHSRHLLLMNTCARISQ